MNGDSNLKIYCCYIVRGIFETLSVDFRRQARHCVLCVSVLLVVFLELRFDGSFGQLSRLVPFIKQKNT